MAFFLCNRGQILDNPTLAFSILIQQRERNSSIGINNDPQFLRGMVAYIRNTSENHAKDATRLLVRAAYLKAMIEEHQVLAGRLTEYIMANIEDDDIRNEGVYAMTKLEAYVTHLGDELEVLFD